MTALLLLPAPHASVASWVRRGVVACHVVERGGWSLVVPASERTEAVPPYDDPVSLLLARATGPRATPSIGVGVLEDRAVVVTQSSGWRTLKRWGARSRYGPLVRLADLPPLRPDDLLGAVGPGADRTSVAAALDERRLTTHEWLAHLVDACGLPGADVLRTEADLGPVVEPDERSVTAFERVVKDVGR